MKKLIINLIAVLFVTLGSAQSNSAVVNQTGNNNTATNDQTGYMNVSQQDQTGDDNTSEFVQTGVENNAISKQIGNEHKVFVDQIGDKNNADVVQGNSAAYMENLADVDQLGYADKAIVSQKYSKLGEVFITQNGSNDALLNNSLYPNTNNYAYAVQQRDDNFADIDQTGYNNGLYSGQIGYRNTVYSTQTSTSRIFSSNYTRKYFNNYTWLRQIRDDNTINSIQNGNENYTKIDQNGYRNVADVLVYNGNGNYATIAQTGNDNEAYTRIGEYGQANDNDVRFMQNGNSNYMEANLNTANSNVVKEEQVGHDNYFRVTIKGDSNELNMTSTGNANRGSWRILSDWPDYSDYNTLDIDQTGDDNITTGVVAGDFNDIDITQEGNNNAVGSGWWLNDGVNILGSMNDVDIMQTGQGNSSLNTIIGGNNIINVSQSN